eukprot:8192561-Karenia_brevis.AAC.1
MHDIGILHPEAVHARNGAKLCEGVFLTLESLIETNDSDTRHGLGLQALLNDIKFHEDTLALELMVQGFQCGWDYQNEDWRLAVWALFGTLANTKYPLEDS